MKRKAIIPLVLGLGIGLLAVKFGIDSIRRAQASNASRQSVTVVRAKQDIAGYEEIQKDMVETVETADSLFAPANERLDKVELAIGRVASKPIAKNTPVLLSMLAPPGTRAGMVGRIPPGFRAVSVKIDEVSGVAYQVQPGDWVDVIVVMDVETGARGKKETIAEVILQHVQVAAIGQGTGPEPEPAKGAQMKPAKSATLLVPEIEVPKLHLAGTRGKITLAMRGEDDKTPTLPARAYESEIMNSTRSAAADKTPPAPTPPPPPVAKRAPAPPEPEPHAVLVFHGSMTNQAKSVERITFENAHSARILEMSQGGPTRASMMMSGAKGRSPAAAPKPTGAAKTPGDQGGSPGTEPGDVDTEDETPGDQGGSPVPDAGE
jgi:pilus assembly protein CpaB